MLLYELLQVIQPNAKGLESIELGFMTEDDWINIPTNVRSITRFADAPVIGIDTDIFDDSPILVVTISDKPENYLDPTPYRDKQKAYFGE